MNKWDRHFLREAKLISEMSKDPSTKCGAVIVRPRENAAPKIVSKGFNGFPIKTKDEPELYEDRELKLDRVVHAELNAIIQAATDLHDCWIYTWPPGWGGSCARCSAHIIQAGISKLVHIRDESDFGSRWKESSQRGLDMYEEAGVLVVHYSLDEWNNE
jgi:dCMP deaminase